MYTPRTIAANAYAKVGLESDVMGASPYQLIVLLYEGAEQAVRMAIRHIQDGALIKKSEAISKATSIILEGLRAALDPRHNTELVAQLEALYDYMVKRIMEAHLKNDTAPLEEVLGLLRELHEAWLRVGSAAQATPRTLQHPIAA